MAAGQKLDRNVGLGLKTSDDITAGFRSQCCSQVLYGR